MSVRRSFDEYIEALECGRVKPNEPSTKSVLAGCLTMPFVILVGVLLRGWALQALWAWFIVPFGVMAVSLPWAMGIAILVHMLTSEGSPSRRDDESFGAAYCRMLLVCWGAPMAGWMGGWIWHAWM